MRPNPPYAVLPTLIDGYLSRLDKTAVVTPDLKQYRRFLQQLAGTHTPGGAATHNFHGTGHMPEVVRSGTLHPGSRDLHETGGVYLSQRRPAPSYFQHGGFSIPADHVQAHGGRVIPGQETGPNPYMTAPKVPLEGSGATVVVTRPHPEVLDAARQAQQQYGMRRVDKPAYETAYEVARNKLPPSQAADRLRERSGNYRQLTETYKTSPNVPEYALQMAKSSSLYEKLAYYPAPAVGQQIGQQVGQQAVRQVGQQAVRQGAQRSATRMTQRPRAPQPAAGGSFVDRANRWYAGSPFAQEMTRFYNWGARNWIF